MEDKKVGKRKKIFIRLAVTAVIILVLSVWLMYENKALQTTVYEIKISEENSELDGFTIVQISDLHNANFGGEQSRLIEEICEQEPDMIAVTGDLVDSSRTDMDVAMDFIRQAVDIAPVYYVTGNHEGWIGNTYSELENRLKDAGVHVLDNQVITMSWAGVELNIAGVHDPDMPGNNVVLVKQTISVMMEGTDGYTILLSHRPELYDAYVESGAELVFAGHYHGGQFRIPFIGGVIAPGQGLFPEYTEGTFTENGTTMVVSRGLGNSVIPVRINNRPEIVVVKLMANAE